MVRDVKTNAPILSCTTTLGDFNRNKLPVDYKIDPCPDVPEPDECVDLTSVFAKDPQWKKSFVTAPIESIRTKLISKEGADAHARNAAAYPNEISGQRATEYPLWTVSYRQDGP